MRLEGKRALVTGGAAGLGLAIATALAGEGAKVAVWDWQIEVVPPNKFPITAKVDVSSGEMVSQAAAELLAQWGGLDILVNNAGICIPGTVRELTEGDWDRVMAVNLKGTFLCSKAFAPAMQEQGSGKIINLGSISGKNGGIAAGSAYSASKAGIMCFTMSLARELSPHGINVNAMAPGVIATDMSKGLSKGDYTAYKTTIPLGRVGEAKEVAALALFLAGPDSDYLTGEIIDINGGMYMD
ncbi:MAG: 3-oxoacyl-ACP reductase FabG [Desulfarculaceae bacterium]|nr:3-oxoacyl-ACP reductase FabG [Desulfarculaceae bacterium]MCF8047168.1 3-oxoacyl-ACP reductase FabG [Desulfarculaceae bacterium]MCF8064327.1 3-oxoacyl-ACP reductase FabG [Desulfarculaceae bacterium]MCF8121450.1 3-oxoacyl-ACP reductase FabG [Desulfarculaceae bacterium]